MRPILLMLFFYFTHSCLFAQDTSSTFKQNIRGKIVDSETRYPLIGAKIKVIGLKNQLIGSVCDENGDFLLKTFLLANIFLRPTIWDILPEKLQSR